MPALLRLLLAVVLVGLPAMAGQAAGRSSGGTLPGLTGVTVHPVTEGVLPGGRAGVGRQAVQADRIGPKLLVWVVATLAGILGVAAPWATQVRARARRRNPGTARCPRPSRAPPFVQPA